MRCRSPAGRTQRPAVVVSRCLRRIDAYTRPAMWCGRVRQQIGTRKWASRLLSANDLPAYRRAIAICDPRGSTSPSNDRGTKDCKETWFSTLLPFKSLIRKLEQKPGPQFYFFLNSLVTGLDASGRAGCDKSLYSHLLLAQTYLTGVTGSLILQRGNSATEEAENLQSRLGNHFKNLHCSVLRAVRVMSFAVAGT